MKPIFSSRVIIKNWLDITNCENYPEAQEVAYRKIHLYFDDILQAELYLEMNSVITSIQQQKESCYL